MAGLHPPAEPRAVHRLAAGDGHELYVEDCGPRDGFPVIFLHGGPGSMCTDRHRRLFDPRRHRAILFDQRGCGRSRPAGEIRANSAEHLVADIELIRVHLGIEAWLVWGGSWGSLLALAYAATRPERVRALLLRGIFLGGDRELDAYLANFQGRTENEAARDCIRRLQHDFESAPASVRAEITRRWLAHEAALMGETIADAPPEASAIAKTRLQLHYLARHAYPRAATLLEAAARHVLPGIIVQGDNDPICPPGAARALAGACPSLRLQEIPGAGHGQFDPEILAASLAALDALTS